MNWSPQQQAMLAAMGYSLYRHVATTVPEAARVDAAPAARVVTAPGPTPTGGDFAGLRAALERAAGGRDLSPLALSLAEVRASAAAKRALWPRLRALRRS